MSIVITEDMERVMGLIENTNECAYVTGKAGTGKTTLLKHIVSSCRKSFIVSASTGIAALNAGGVTLHSLFNIPFYVYEPNSFINLGNNPVKYELFNSLETIIIDEISMVRPDTMDYIDKKLRMYRKNEEPFGGVQIIMFGDLMQLPPVVTADERNVLLLFYKGPYFFYANVFRSCGFRIIELNRVFRQSDSRFIEILNNIRSYNITQENAEDLSELRNKGESELYDNDHIHICAYRRDVQRINREMLGEATHTYIAKVERDFNIKSAPCEQELKLRTGARVMMVANDRHRTYYNGSLGTVAALDKMTVTVKLDNGCIAKIEPYEWSEYEYKVKDGKITHEVKGTCRQFPITLGWAITIHKSQGLTFDNVIIHAKGIFAPGQIYVALSRCTSMERIVSDVFIDQRHIFPDRELLSFEAAYKKTGCIFNRETYKLIENESIERSA